MFFLFQLIISLYDIVLRSKRKLRDVLRAPVLVDHDDVVLPDNDHGITVHSAVSHLYPPAPGLPSGTVIMGSMEITIPGLTTVSMSSRSSRPASRP